MGKKQSKAFKSAKRDLEMAMVSHLDFSGLSPYQAEKARQRAVAKMRQAGRGMGGDFHKWTEFTDVHIEGSDRLRADFWTAASILKRDFDRMATQAYFDALRVKMVWPDNRTLRLRCEMHGNCDRGEPNEAPSMYWLEQFQKGERPHITHFARGANEVDFEAPELMVIHGKAVYKTGQDKPVDWLYIYSRSVHLNAA